MPESKDQQEVVGTSSTAPEPADRIFLLECRLDQLHSALLSARVEADATRRKLAESAVREVDHLRRATSAHEELASAREELAALHRRFEHAEALRAEVEGRLIESGARDEAGELARLRREVSAERQRAETAESTASELRLRVEELTATREALMTRIAEWQSVVRQGDPEAVDLAEFIASLRGDILALEHRASEAERREAELKERLDGVGVAVVIEAPVDDGVEESVPANELTTALAAAESPESRIELLLRLGKSRKESALYAIRPYATAPEPRVRAAAFEAMGRLLENDPGRLEPQLRWGLADGDARVRRRVVLAAASARGLALRPLLEPLKADPDAQVRRVTHEVLRRTSSSDDVEAAVPAATGVVA